MANLDWDNYGLDWNIKQLVHWGLKWARMTDCLKENHM